MSERTAPPMTVSVAFVRSCLSGLSPQGDRCVKWLQAVGIDPALSADNRARVTLAQYSALLRLMSDECDDELLGLLPRRSKRGSFALQVRSAIGPHTLEVAIRHVVHTFRLLHDEIELVLLREDGLAGLALRVSAVGAAHPFLQELLLRVYWRLLAWLVGGQLPPVRFDFAFARPAHADGYARIFPAPWRFEAPISALWFEESRLWMPVRRDEAALRTFVSNGLVNVIVPTRDAGVAGRVRVYLQQTQPTWPDLEHTANALHMSASSLQRHLASENTSFQELKDQLRRDIAIFRLNTSSVPLATLASELGFAEAAAFQRAFKSWTGCAPGVYRRGGGQAKSQ